MKFLLLFCFVLSLYGDDLKRIETIVNDIDTLRKDYVRVEENLATCKNDLKQLKQTNQDYLKVEKSLVTCKSDLKQLKQKNIAISLDTTADQFQRKEREYLKTIKNLKNQIKLLKNKPKTKVVKTKNIVKTKIIRIKEEKNPFPKLLLKDK